MKRIALLSPALVLAVGLLATGCGGGDDSKASDEPTAAAITKADFTEQANAICAKGNAEIETAANALGDDPTTDQITQFATDTLVPNVQGQHDSISDLGAPKGDEVDVDAILTALQDGIDTLAADPAVITAEGDDPFAAANDLAAAYGLTDCTG